MSTKGIHIQDY